jgi:hypothetical protein
MPPGEVRSMESNSIEILFPQEKAVTISGESHPIHILTYPEARGYANAIIPLVKEVLAVRGGEQWSTEKMGAATLQAIVDKGGDLIPNLIGACYPTLKDRQSEFPLDVTLQLFAAAWNENNVFGVVANFFGRMKAGASVFLEMAAKAAGGKDAQ